MKTLKDYLHLYLGCECIAIDDDGRGFRDNILQVEYHRRTLKFLSAGIYEWGDVGEDDLHNIKPILRPLSDMTEEEEHEAYSIKGANGFSIFEGETTRYLLSKHFDIFDLIESGLAIDATTLRDGQ